PHSDVGQKFFCPGCGQKLQVPQPPPNKTVLGTFTPVAPTPPPPVPAQVYPVVIAQAPPPPLPVDGYDAYPDRRRRRRGRGFRCPFCDSTEPPVTREELGSEAWILFVVLLLFFIPLCWLPFVTMKKRYRVCYDCGARLD